jgi:hypothetical protein
MGQRNRGAFSSIFFLICLVALSCAACTRAELVDKANAYDEAIWDSSNRQILLNAVRASQRAPMSFVGFGDVLASPNFSGSAAGTFNLAPSVLTNYSLNPTVTYGGGFRNSPSTISITPISRPRCASPSTTDFANISIASTGRRK